MAMSVDRIRYLLGALWIGLGTFALLTLVLTLVAILPGGRSGFTVSVLFYALGVGMIPWGIYYVLSVRRKRGLPAVS